MIKRQAISSKQVFATYILKKPKNQWPEFRNNFLKATSSPIKKGWKIMNICHSTIVSACDKEDQARPLNITFFVPPGTTGNISQWMFLLITIAAIYLALSF